MLTIMLLFGNYFTVLSIVSKKNPSGVGNLIIVNPSYMTNKGFNMV